MLSLNRFQLSNCSWVFLHFSYFVYRSVTSFVEHKLQFEKQAWQFFMKIDPIEMIEEKQDKEYN